MTAVNPPPTSYEVFAGSSADASFSAWLRERSGSLWDRMVHHRFTREMASGRIDPGVLRRYLVFEHRFVETAVVIFGYALVRAPSIVEQARLGEVLHGLTGDQLTWFDRVFAQVGIGDAERRAVDPPAGVLAFDEGMLGLAAHGSYEEIIGSMTAAEWMYHTWCTEAHAVVPSDPVVAEWVHLHVTAAFAEQVAWMRAQVDHHGPALAPWRQERVAHAFSRTLALEIDFHDAPYEPASGTREGSA